jgi:hypothetical protein
VGAATARSAPLWIGIRSVNDKNNKIGRQGQGVAG